MNLKKNCFQPQNRRGLSSVVGALFFTVLMISGFSVLGLALDAQEDIVITQRVISDIEIKKQQEEFGVLASIDENDFLSVSIQNQGQNPVEISSVWITNKTLSDQPAKRYAINYADAFVSSGSTTNVLDSQTLQLIPDAYGIKVISTLGSIKTVELDTNSCTSSIGLRAELITDPPDVIMGQNVTVAMIVTNTIGGTIYNVHPGELTTGGSGTVTEISLNSPSMVNLIPGESVMFSWDTRVDPAGTSGQDVVFSAQALGKVIKTDDAYTCIVSDTSIIRDPADSGDTTVIVLTQDLLSRPEIFMIIPSPMGDGSAVADKALWGSNIVNPTGQDMYVNKFVVSLLSPRSNNNDIMFGTSGTHVCAAEAVPPTPDKWSCPEPNQLMWEDLSNPIKISPYSVFPFMALVHPDRLASGGDELSAVIVHGNVWTTVGQFGKAGYGTSFDNAGTSIASVFLSKDVNSVNKNDMLSNQTGIDSGSLVTFNVTLADLESGGHYIDDTSRLIINVPKGWLVDFDSITDVDFEIVSYEEFSDTSTQIIGDLRTDLVSGGASIQFKAEAPTVSNPQMYVMYLLADGSADNGDFTIGPLQEAVLQVIPPP